VQCSNPVFEYLKSFKLFCIKP